MNKKMLIVILLVAVICLGIGFYVGTKYDNNKCLKEPGTVLPTDGSVKDVETKLVLNQAQEINCLERMNIEGTNDYFAITKVVKWQEPEYEPGTTVSFSIAIPYTLTIDGVEHEGIYELGDSTWSKDDNTKYKVEIVNLTEDGVVTVKVTNK